MSTKVHTHTHAHVRSNSASACFDYSQGTLLNLGELTARFQPNWSEDTTISAAQTNATTAEHAANGVPPKDPHSKPNAAELVLWMYLQLGPKALSYLHGRWVFI